MCLILRLYLVRSGSCCCRCEPKPPSMRMRFWRSLASIWWSWFRLCAMNAIVDKCGNKKRTLVTWTRALKGRKFCVRNPELTRRGAMIECLEDLPFRRTLKLSSRYPLFSGVPWFMSTIYLFADGLSRLYLKFYFQLGRMPENHRLSKMGFLYFLQ